MSRDQSVAKFVVKVVWQDERGWREVEVCSPSRDWTERMVRELVPSEHRGKAAR